MTEFTPTYLYIKQHEITGKKYFGKTIKDPLRYNGSGSYWVRHVRKHGKGLVRTLWYELFTNKEDIVEFAEFFSDLHDIVNSDEWANQIAESGLDYSTGVKRPNWNYKHSEEIKQHLREQKLGIKRKPFTEEARKNMSDAHKGKSSGAKGKTWKRKTESPLKGIPRPKIACDVCGKLVCCTGLNRYHNNNCKFNLQ